MRVEVRPSARGLPAGLVPMDALPEAVLRAVLLSLDARTEVGPASATARAFAQVPATSPQQRGLRCARKHESASGIFKMKL